MAPEVFEGRKYSYSCDIWSLGMCILTLMNMKHPYDGIDINNKLMDDLKNNRIFKYNINNRKYDNDLINLIKSMLKYDDKQRITLNQILTNKNILKRLHK